MPGGNWLVQNKIRPGAYINFSQVPTPLIQVGDRGIATIAIDLPWGAEGELIDVLSSDMIDGTSRMKIGYTANDTEESLIARTMLSNCYRVKFFRLNSGGAKATAIDTTTKIQATAKYNGTAGNKIIIQIAESKITPGRFTITTFWNGLEVASQVVTEISQVQSNDYVIFDVSAENAALGEIAGMPLVGGQDGTYNKENYTKYFSLLRTARWQCMAIIKEAATLNATTRELVKQMRDAEGRKVQAAIFDTMTTYDYEGIIRSEQGLMLENNEKLTPELVPALVAAMTAGADITQSNTHREIQAPAAVGIINEYTNQTIIEKLEQGAFLFSARDDGTIQCEKDINTFHTFVPTKGYPFSKNKVIRVLDEMNMSISGTWDKSYSGKVSNSDTGRQIFKGDVLNYIATLQGIGAVDTTDKDGKIYDSNKNVTVKRGEKIDTVYCKIYDLPVVDSMEILYVDCIIQS